MNLKKIAAGLLLTAALVACESGPELLGLIPTYNGPAVTSTTHTFDNKDFAVIASYADGTDKILEPDEFEVEVVEMVNGYYILNVTYGEMDNECYVPMELEIYPSDKKD